MNEDKKYAGQPDDQIWFYDNDKNYYEFTNFWPATPLSISEVPENLRSLGVSSELTGYWKTSEHLFQAAKFTDKGIIEEIRKIYRPSEARSRANSRGIQVSGWHGSVKVEVMRWAVKEKFFQNSELKELLWETGNKKLVEHTGNDREWGDGGDGSGQNKLGEILMEIRQEIIAEKGECEEVVDESEIPGIKKPESTGEKDTKDKDKKTTLIQKKIQEIKNKLKTAKISSEQEVEILGSSWETNYRMSWVEISEEEVEDSKKEALKAINEYIANKNLNNNHNQNENKKNQGANELNKQPIQSETSSSPTQPNPEPTQQQVNNAKDKLDQAQEDGVDEEEIIRIIKEIFETVKNSGDENLKKQKEEAEKKLSKDKLREIIREEIKSVLAEEKIKPEELTLTVKQKLDELNNNNNDQTTRAEIFNEIGKISLNKLINTLEQALKVGNNKQLVRKVKELQIFINSKVDYKQKAYKLQKDKVEKLLNRVKVQQSKSANQEGFFHSNNPLMWISGIVLISLVAGGIMMVIRIRYRKRKTRIK